PAADGLASARARPTKHGTRRSKPMSRILLAAVAVVVCAAPAQAQVPPGYPADYANLVAAANKEGRVLVYSTTDAAAANPLLKDFASLYPGVKVDYTDMNSTELYSRFIAP